MRTLYRRGLALLLAACTLLASCGSRAEAATMHLRKTEGTVGVSDGEGKDLEPRENLGLYSGYGVDTRAESYAWVNLDSVKLTKLDQNSEIEIVKEDRHLTIEVKSGNLFFNVTEPLAEDESLDIRTSTMAVGIRGTCGWVTEDTVCLLEGTVTVTAGEQTATVTAGEMARVSAGGEITVAEFSAGDVPAFVLEEIEDDSGLMEAVSKDSETGPDASAPITGLDTVASYGGPTVTQEQAAVFAKILREEVAGVENDFSPATDAYIVHSEPRCFAGILNVDGTPALLYGCANAVQHQNGQEELWLISGKTKFSIWELVDGQAVERKLGSVSIYDGYMYAGGVYGGAVYPFIDGRIAEQPSTNCNIPLETGRPHIDGQQVTKEQFDAWQARWNPGDSLAGAGIGSDIYVRFWGLSLAEDVLAVLEGNG